MADPNAITDWQPIKDPGDWQPIAPEMPDPVTAFGHGLSKTVRDFAQAADIKDGIAGKGMPEEAPEGPESEGLSWGDFAHPMDKALPKLAYGMGSSGGSLAGGVAGGVIGGWMGGGAGAAATGPAAPVGAAVGGTGGALVGGVLGAAAGQVAQSIGPEFARALKENPADPDAAFATALRRSGESGAIAGVSWAAFGFKPFGEGVKHILFQAFGVQPAVNAAGKVAENAADGAPLTEGVAEGLPGSVAGTLVPAAGHHAVERIMGKPAAKPAPAPPAAEGEPAPPVPPAASERPPLPGPGASTVDRLRAINGEPPAPPKSAATQALEEIAGDQAPPPPPPTPSPIQQVIEQAKAGGGPDKPLPINDNVPGQVAPPAPPAELYQRAVALVRGQSNASTSWLQRQLGLAYPDAAALMARLEQDGVVSPADHGGRRTVLPQVPPVPPIEAPRPVAPPPVLAPQDMPAPRDLPAPGRPVEPSLDANGEPRDDLTMDMFGGPPEPPPAPLSVTPAQVEQAVHLEQSVPDGRIPTYSPGRAAMGSHEGEPAGIFAFDAATLKTDPARFQYKSDTDNEGVSTKLKGVTKWDQAKAGQIVAYEDKDGQVYVADGHQRTGLARRLKGQDPSIQTPVTGILYRAADGWEPHQVMALAAAKNLAEGSGSAVDAAKILRAYPQLLDGSVPMSEAKSQQAQALAALSDEPWRMVTNGKVDPAHAAEVGRLLPDDPAKQLAAMDVLARAEPESVAQAESLVSQVRDSHLNDAQTDMFGGGLSTSGVIEKSRIMATAGRILASDRKVFATLVKEADRIQSAGNKLKAKENESRAHDAATLMQEIKALAYRHGPISDALTQAAKELQAGRQLRDVSRDFLKAVGKAQPFEPEVLERGRSGRPLRRAPLGSTEALLEGIAEHRPPEHPDYDVRGENEPDKDYAKRAIDTGPEVTHLPEVHDRYFNTEGAETVPLENLHSTKSDEENAKGGDNGAKRMQAAWWGLLGKRDPITVMPSAERAGHYDVVDGNGTTTSARRLGWDSLPVRVVDRETGAAMINADRAKDAKKAGLPAPEPYRAYPDRITSVDTEPPPAETFHKAPKSARDPNIDGYDDNGRPFAIDENGDRVPPFLRDEFGEPRLDKNGEKIPYEPEPPHVTHAPKGNGLRDLWHAMWGREAPRTDDPVSGRAAYKSELGRWQAESPHETIEQVFRNALKNQARLGFWGRAVAARLEAAGILPKGSFADPGIKGMERTREKVAQKYTSKGLKAGYLNDAVRAGFTVDRPADGDIVARELAKHFPVVDEGWQINDAGYFDRKLNVLFEDGSIGEVQLWERGLLNAKQKLGGHAMYEEARKPSTAPWRKLELNAQMRTLYGRAYDALSPEWKAAVPRYKAEGNSPPALNKGSRTDSSGEGTSNRAAKAAGDSTLASGETPPGSGTQRPQAGDQPSTTGNTGLSGNENRTTANPSSLKNSALISGMAPPDGARVGESPASGKGDVASDATEGKRPPAQAMSRKRGVNASPAATSRVQAKIQAKIDSLSATPPSGGGGSGQPPAAPPPPAAPGVPPARRPLAAIHGYIQEKVGQLLEALHVNDLIHSIQLFAAPMADLRASPEARAIAKDFANAQRLADWQWQRMNDVLRRDFTPDRLAAMWEAADEESVMLQTGETPSGAKLADMTPDERNQYGIGRLSPEEREVVQYLQDRANDAWQRAKDAGMIDPDAMGLPSYVPRMVVKMADDGSISHVVGKPAGRSRQDAGKTGNPVEGKLGQNLRTTSDNLRHREHLTTGDTEAAAKAKFGADAAVVRDIRTLALATATLEKAVAGKRMMDQIKAAGRLVGSDTVREGGHPNDGAGWFTVATHPAFNVWRPELVQDPVTGKFSARLDADGQPIMQRQPLYVRGDFQGPLMAVLSQKNGAIYNGLMGLKGRAMMAIMYSPLIHNMVEYGRAIPAAPLKVATGYIYFKGNALKNDPHQMREAINAGMVPIGHRGGFQDITSVMNQDDAKPGRSLLAKGLGKIGDLAGVGDSLRRGVDKAGDVWHNTLLWDRVGDLQAGLYGHFRDKFTAQGMDPLTAQRLAAHMANRYAGALPKEAMGHWAQKTANLLLFSRSFTLGNLGAMKDAVTGLPRDVQAQILRDAGEQAMRGARNSARLKTIGMLATDIGLMYGMNSLLQSMSNVLLLNGSLDEEMQEYARRFHEELGILSENPLQLVGTLGRLASTADNEPGKQDRILVGKTAEGTGIYARNPVGKIGEEFTGWSAGPVDMIKRKLSTFARPFLELATNDTGFGHKLYDPNAKPLSLDWLKNAGKIAWAFVGAQVPGDSIAAAGRLATGHPLPMDPYKVAGPLAGVTFSRGYPGGPAMGEAHDIQERKRFADQEEMPKIREMIQAGDEDGAISRMTELGWSQKRQASVLKLTERPGSRLSPRTLNRMAQDSERLQRARDKWDRVPAPPPPTQP